LKRFSLNELHRVEVVLTGSAQVEDGGNVRVTNARRGAGFTQKAKPRRFVSEVSLSNDFQWYADLVFKYSQLWNYFSTPTAVGTLSKGPYDIPTLGGSLELGRRFDFAGRRFFVEPQAQLAGAWASAMDYQATNGLRVHGDDQYSLQGRLGLRTGLQFSLGGSRVLEPYLIASVIHEFETGNQVQTNTTGFANNLAGTTGRFGAGVTASVSPRICLYAEYDYSVGDKLSEPWAVNLGFRWQW
jgi:outer membrane autotransporter protein